MEKREFKVGDIVIGKQVNIRAVSGIVYRVFTLDYKRKIAEIKEDKIRLREDTDVWFYAKDFKLETMKKEIEGYVLIKEYPGSKGLGYFEKYTTGELNKYPEFWKPVYEEKFKVGDWVTIIKGASDDSKRLADRTLKIKKIATKFNYIEVEEGTSGLHYNSGKEDLSNEFRKATPEEIEAAQKQTIQMYSSNKGMFEIEVVDGKAYYRPENKHLPKEWIRDIINSYGNILIQKNVINPYNVEISSINVGCYHNCKKEDWENVYKLLK